MITPSQDHLTTEQIVAYASNDLDSDEERLFEEHIDSCNTCRHSAESFILSELQFPIHEWAKRKTALVARLKHDTETVLAATTAILRDAENRTDSRALSGTDTVLSTPWYSIRSGTLSLREPLEIQVRADASLELVKGPAPQLPRALQQGHRAAVLGPEPRTKSWLLEDHEGGFRVTLTVTATVSERVGKVVSISAGLMNTGGSRPASSEATFEILDKGDIGLDGKPRIEKSGRISELRSEPVYLKCGEWLVRISLSDKTRVWEIPIHATEE